MDQLTDPFSSWLPFLVAIGFGVVMTIRAYMGGQVCISTNKIDGQIVIVTGSSGGIGLEICKELCQRSAHVIMACKDIKKANAEMSLIKKAQPFAKIEVRYMDLSSFDCIRRFAKTIHSDFTNVDVLINNAGLIFNTYEKTVDGFETHLQINCLGHFLLTYLLMPLLQKSIQGRVINVSAHAHSTAKINVEDPLNIGTWAPAFHQRDAFAHSKLVVLLVNRHYAKIMKDSSVTINTLTPGLVRGTDHLRRSPIMNAICAKTMTYPWMWIFMKSPKQGAQTAIYLATEPSLRNVTGEYFNDCQRTELMDMAASPELAKICFLKTVAALQIKL